MGAAMDFLKTHSHEIFCWAWAVGICAICFVIMLIVDSAWNMAYKRGFNDGVKSVAQKTPDSVDIPRKFRKEHYYS